MGVFFVKKLSSRFYIFTVLYLFDRCFLSPHLISFYLFSTFFFQLIFILFTLCSVYKNAQESCHFRENKSFNFKEKNYSELRDLVVPPTREILMLRSAVGLRRCRQEGIGSLTRIAIRSVR